MGQVAVLKRIREKVKGRAEGRIHPLEPSQRLPSFPSTCKTRYSGMTLSVTTQEKKPHDHRSGLPASVEAHYFHEFFRLLLGSRAASLFFYCCNMQQIVLCSSEAVSVRLPSILSLSTATTAYLRRALSILTSTRCCVRNGRTRTQSTPSLYGLKLRVELVPTPLVEHLAICEPAFDPHGNRLIRQIRNDFPNHPPSRDQILSNYLAAMLGRLLENNLIGFASHDTF